MAKARAILHILASFALLAGASASAQDKQTPVAVKLDVLRYAFEQGCLADKTAFTQMQPMLSQFDLKFDSAMLCKCTADNLIADQKIQDLLLAPNANLETAETKRYFGGQAIQQMFSCVATQLKTQLK